ncbi:hypothetical protein HPB52_005774 [Rhipicephalus sanguineus]|uniref:Uncharacterized protein n=1 Tax=Rhipicephalus sanguineus TaxID=34632 RepID=A0A9D4QII7_RHISA|nr:hypothetical protein HPB52_005774 [Rhipicephalus sanguineus]
MESELETRVNLPVVQVNRGGLYAVVAVLGIVILACVCVLAYSFSNYAMLKRNAEEMRLYIASRTNMTGQLGGDKPAADGDTAGDGHPPSLKSLEPAAAMPRIILGSGLGKRAKKSHPFLVKSANGTLVMTARQEAFVATAYTQRLGASRGAGGGKTPAAVAAVASKAPAAAYDILVASVNWNDPHSK